MPKKLIATVLFLLVTAGIGNHAIAFENEDIMMHGFVSQGYLKSSDNNYLGNSKDGSYEFNEIGITFSVPVTDNLRFGIQLFSRDIGEFGNNDFTVDWALLDYTFQDWLGIRAGKIKLPLGLYNRQREADHLRTSIIFLQSVYAEDMRDFVIAIHGISLYGSQELGVLGYLDYEFFGGTADIPGDTPFVQNMLARNEYINKTVFDLFQSLEIDIAEFEIIISHIEGGTIVWNPPLKGFRIGGTYITGKGEADISIMFADIEINDISTLSLEYDIGNLTLAAEYMNMDIEMLIPGLFSSSAHLGGWYVSASWEATNWVALGISYGEFTPDTNDRDGDIIESGGLPDYYAWQNNITLSVRFNITEFWCVKVESHFIDGLGQTLLDKNPVADSEDEWYLFAVKTSLNF